MRAALPRAEMFVVFRFVESRRDGRQHLYQKPRRMQVSQAECLYANKPIMKAPVQHATSVVTQQLRPNVQDSQ